MSEKPSEQLPSEADDIQAELLRKQKALRHMHEVYSRNKLEAKEKRENEDPRMHYEWASPDPQYMAHLEAKDMGFVVCNKTNAPKLKSRWRKDDGTHVQGDMILVMCPIEMKQADQEHNSWRAGERERQTPAGYTPELGQFAKESGVAIAPLGAE